MTVKITDILLKSGEPSVRWKILVNVLGENPKSAKIKKLQEEIKDSARVKAMLKYRNSKGEITSGSNVYAKWQGAHWILSALADIGYPAGDKSLLPVKDQLLSCWLNDYYYKEFVCESKQKVYRGEGVPVMQGRYRRCASQQGNALWSLLKLGLNDKRLDNLAERLLYWQWPDGGWNCDKDPNADTSSFMESLYPMRGLFLYSKIKKDKKSGEAAKRASGVFLKRKLYRRISNGNIIHPEFTYLHYPLYWHYDILGGLKVMAECGFIKDARCNDSLDLLESKILPDGGFPAEKSYYNVSGAVKLGSDFVNWGGTSKKKMNEWITADALYVLKEAGRLS